ncbi:RES domain-containing protein [Pseudoduganella sp. DS3]|uniref:RES domain-containing protein n=1 Tax=Pseudoduganella guangdongensis TaxID=2692179 RepID=A0A6N9HL55_9BURK|nr:RES family NAD+ phosphorylase [Pseudoduganella guangdongensis]MYN04401.1 RES domain-containing protein [Pseudoduganella guangdongensis]
MTGIDSNNDQIILCSNCFADEGLRIDAIKLGLENSDECPQCKSTEGRKLMENQIEALAHRFFVRGTIVRHEYGGAPIIQCNEHHYGESTITPSQWLKNDLKLIENSVKVGFFHYGPRLWMIGEVEPLKALQDSATRNQVIKRILAEYPVRVIEKNTKFYRLRISPQQPAAPSEYDSPPIHLAGKGRLDSAGFPVMYGSQDLDICIHECRASIDDDLYVATLKTQKELRLLDLTHVLEEDGSEFESLDMAVHMLFLARSHSYDISRAIALKAKNEGFDGVIYPSYFSLIRTGGYPFETAYGLSVRRFAPQREQYAEAYTIPNFALFGRPLEDGLVRAECINRLILTQIGYLGHFGPVEY